MHDILQRLNCSTDILAWSRLEHVMALFNNNCFDPDHTETVKTDFPSIGSPQLADEFHHIQ
jgi:hypothetical protein